MVLVCDLAEEFTTCIEIKNCGNAHGAEEANKKGLSPLFNLVDAFAHGKNNGKTAEQEDEDGDENESVDRDNITMREAVPGANSTVPDEDGHIEEHVDGGLEGVVFRLLAKPITCRWSTRPRLVKDAKRLTPRWRRCQQWSMQGHRRCWAYRACRRWRAAHDSLEIHFMSPWLEMDNTPQ